MATTQSGSHPQRYEYKKVKNKQGLRNPEGVDLNKYAEDGWRLVETVEGKGTTTQFIFERPVTE